MGNEQYKDAEIGEATKGLQDLQEPFIQQEKKTTNDFRYVEADKRVDNGSIAMVLLSTFVAVCGSFSFGTCVSICCSFLSTN